MNTKFNSLQNGGGQIIFASFLISCLLPMFSFGQVDPFTIYGESLWRNQGYGVANHYFQIENYVIPEMEPHYPPTNPVTAACPDEVYTTDYMPLYTFNQNAYANTLKIRPFSINNYSDYTNGVNAVDLTAIANHLMGTPYFEARTPTEDAPFRYISADAEYDSDVDLDDAYMIEDLLLGHRYDLERNSWEWVHKDEVEEGEERFEEAPYEFVIDYNWPGSEGIIIAAVTTNQIIADNDKYFTFRTTKIGDITANAGLPYPGANSWVCGNSTYLNDDHIETRSISDQVEKKVRSGSTITVAVLVETESDILAIQVPIHFSNEDFRLSGMQFSNNFHPRWNYNTYIQSLVVLDFSINGQPLPISRGQVLEFKLTALRDLKNVIQAIRWSDAREMDLVGMDEDQIEAGLRLEIIDILPPDLFVEIREGDGNRYIFIESPSMQSATIQIYNEQGIQVFSKESHLLRGDNFLKLDAGLIGGMYFVNVIGDNNRTSTRFFSK